MWTRDFDGKLGHHSSDGAFHAVTVSVRAGGKRPDFRRGFQVLEEVEKERNRLLAE